MTIREEADLIIKNAIEEAMPNTAVRKAIGQMNMANGEIYLVAIGKAAWEMAKATNEILGENIKQGVVITKYKHAKGTLQNIDIYEAGHPVPDENSFVATQKVIDMVCHLREEDLVLFLISGGGSALFEKPLVDYEELEDITKQMLACGADIREINTVRKRLSEVKGGKFAEICKPAQINAIILSDIIGDPLDMIASGPAYSDSTTCEEANQIIDKYYIKISGQARKCLAQETPKSIGNVTTYVTGSVKQLCVSAERTAKQLGYETTVLSDCISCEAREAGAFLGAIARTHYEDAVSRAYICGGETIVKLVGNGLGGRNQELALNAAREIVGLKEVAIFSVGSDGTDGPTDAAGGYVDGETVEKLSSLGIDIEKELNNNNAYYALQSCEGLIITGPTGTNVNDLTVLLIKKERDIVDKKRKRY